jgi:hypothetical protein
MARKITLSLAGILGLLVVQLGANDDDYYTKSRQFGEIQS